LRVAIGLPLRWETVAVSTSADAVAPAVTVPDVPSGTGSGELARYPADPVEQRHVEVITALERIAAAVEVLAGVSR
jgi:hypothetical protein